MRNIHRPFHLYTGHTYFLTARCYEQYHTMTDEDRRHFFQKKLGELAKEMEISVFAYTILTNHYHVMFRLSNQNGMTSASSSEHNGLASVTPNDTFMKQKLFGFIRRLHAITATEFNRRDSTPGRKIWYQYYDYCIRNIPDFWKHFNYIVQNPYKHGLASSLREAYNYRYSSNPTWLKRFGVDGLSQSFVKYPIKEWTPRG